MAKDKKHSIEEVKRFGASLIQTEDLDPVYVALYKAQLPKVQLARLLLSYSCFYHLGAAAQLSEWEGDEYWDLMLNAAANEIPPNMNGEWPGERWPRGAERRHFRGVKCIEAITWFRKFPPEYPIMKLASPGRMISLEEIMCKVQEWPLHGPWISFKIADLLERVWGTPIIFPSDLTIMYKEPRAALDMLDIPAEEANRKLLEFFGKNSAPPDYKRKCGIAECETALCKFKSSVNGHYWIGKDIHEIRKGLKGWGKTADKLLSVMPKEVERGLFR